MAAPINLAPPVISGTPVVGNTLTLDSNGTWIDDGSPTFTRKWQHDNGGGYFDIFPAQTGTSLLIAQTEDTFVGIRCVVTDTDTGGATAANSNAIGPVTMPPPASVDPASVNTRGSIDGALQIGRAVTYNPRNVSDMWTNMESASALFSLQFQESSEGAPWVDIPGAARLNDPSCNPLNYAIPAGLLGDSLRVKMTATNSGGSATAYTLPYGPVVNVTSWRHVFNFGSRDDGQPLASATWANNLSSVGVNYFDNGAVWTGDDAASLVKKMTAAGVYVLTLDSTKCTDVFDVACHPLTGEVYVAANGQSWVARFTAAGAFLNTVGSNPPSSTPGKFDAPGCVGFLADGSVLVGEEDGGRIQKFTAALVYQSLFASGVSFFAVAPDGTVWLDNDQHVRADGSLIADWSGSPGNIARGSCCDNGDPYRIYTPGTGYVTVLDQTLTPVDYVGWPGSTGAPPNPSTSTAPGEQFAVNSLMWVQVRDGRMVVSDRFYNRVSVWEETAGLPIVEAPPYIGGRGAC